MFWKINMNFGKQYFQIIDIFHWFASIDAAIWSELFSVFRLIVVRELDHNS